MLESLTRAASSLFRGAVRAVWLRPRSGGFVVIFALGLLFVLTQAGGLSATAGVVRALLLLAAVGTVFSLVLRGRG